MSPSPGEAVGPAALTIGPGGQGGMTGRSPSPGGGSPSGLAGLARRGLLSVAGSAVSAAAGIGVVLALTRNLPAGAAGIFFALTSVHLIAEATARLGTSTGVVWAISRARVLGTPGKVPDVLRAALAPVVLLAGTLALILFFGAGNVARLATGSPSGEAADAIRILALLLPATAVSEVLVGATRGHGAILPTVIIDRLGRSLLQLGAVALVAAAGGSLPALALAWGSPWVLSAALAGAWLVRLQRSAVGGAPRPPRDRSVRREFWVFTAPRAATSIVQLALQRLDILLLTVLAGPVQAAVYTAATRFLVIGQFVNQALAAVVEPRIGALLTVSDRSATRTVYQTATGWLVLLVWPFYLVVATAADPLLGLFGAGYDAGVPVVLVLSSTMMVASAIGMVDVVLIMAGRTRWNLGNAVIALAVNVAVDLALIPSLGLLGAAIGWSAAILVKNLLALAQVWRSMGAHPFGAGTGIAAGWSLMCFGLLPLAARALATDGPVPTIVALLAGGLLYVAGCRRWRRPLALDTLRSVRRRAAGPA